jgi:hypothetical protein
LRLSGITRAPASVFVLCLRMWPFALRSLRKPNAMPNKSLIGF